MSEKMLVDPQAVKRMVEDEGMTLGTALIFAAVPVPDEITTLRQQLADAKEENERVRQANIHTMDVFEDMKAAKEKAEARLAELEDALVWALGKLSIEVPLTGGNISYIRAFEKADKALSSNGRAYLLRKQAEAVEKCAEGLTDSRSQAWLMREANQLRNQADEAERAGGEK